MDLGVSAVSLDKSAQVVPDVEAYVFAIRPVWPELNTDTATRLAIAGRILWILKLIAQSTPVFHDYSGRKVEAHMSLYAQVLHESVSFMGWGKPSRNSTGG
jgi:hypothetical protein